MEAFFAFIKEVGFPIAVSVFCLFWLKNTINQVTQVIKENTAIIAKICEKLDIKKD